MNRKNQRSGAAAKMNALLPLRPVVFEMLLILNEGEMHGYGLMKELKERSAGRWILGPGTLYRTINKMVSDEMIEPSDTVEPQTAGKQRLYYRITNHGMKTAAAEASRMANLVRTAMDGQLI